MATLYRTHRPQSFAQVKGQTAIIKTLQNAVSSGQVAHAYLFTGSRGVGKTSVARLLAKAVNCLNTKDGEACLECLHCQGVLNGNFVDLIEIDAASHTGVDNIREIIEHVKFSPVMGKYKVLIIDEVHMLSKPAFNALLKTLEEPPTHAIFILATTDIGKVPATIISRTQRFDFKKITNQEIISQLKEVLEKEKRTLSDDALELIAERSEGGLRDALSLLGQILSLETNATQEEINNLLGVSSRELQISLLDCILNKDTVKICEIVDQISSQNVDTGGFIKDLLEILRQLLVAHMTKQVPKNEALSKMYAITTVTDLVLFIRLFLKAFKDIDISPDTSIPLIVASLECVYKGRLPVQNTEAAVKPVAINTPIVSKSEPTTPPTTDSIKAEEVTTAETSVDTSVTISQIEAVWPEVINLVREINSPLATLLKNSPLIEVERGVVTVAVKYLFHKENLESSKNLSLITNQLQKLTGKTVRFTSRVVKEDVVEAASDTLSSALQVFGGELVQ